MYGGDGGVLAQRRAVIGRPGHEAVHGAIGIDETVGRAEAAADDVIATQARKHGPNFRPLEQANLFQTQGDLLVVVRVQVGQVSVAGGTEQISLWAVVAGIAEPLVEAGVKRD